MTRPANFAGGDAVGPAGDQQSKRVQPRRLRERGESGDRR
jgi:hypothetical protein